MNDQTNNTQKPGRTGSPRPTGSSKAGNPQRTGGGRTGSPRPTGSRTGNPQRQGGNRPPLSREEREARLRRRQAIVRRNRIILFSAIGVVLALIIFLTISLFKGNPKDTEEPGNSMEQTSESSVTPSSHQTVTPSTVQPAATTAAKTTEATTEQVLPKNEITTVDGKKIYVDHEGNIVKNTIISHDGYLYSADADGALTPASGWQEADGKRYYAESDGKLHPGAYITIEGDEYHMDMSGAVIDGTPTIDQYLGCTDLLGWMLDHESDYYYQTNFNPMTDYPDSPEMLIRPYGEYGEDSHMNCAGFIAHLLKSAGGDIDKVADMGGRGGYANADNYLRLCTSGYIKYETFDSIDDLLASGHARKGDILYLEPHWNPGEDCHIGLFWGDTPSEDKFWQQNWDIKNAVTNIRMDDPIVKIYLIPISH